MGAGRCTRVLPSCSSDPRGSGAAEESVILLSITSGTSYAQTPIPVLTADGRSHPRGCLIGTLKIRSQVLIAALGSGACNSGMLGGDSPPPEHCIGDTNICGASWVCAVPPRSCFTPASGGEPSQGRKKKPREEFQQEFSCNSVVCSQILCPPTALECSWEGGSCVVAVPLDLSCVMAQLGKEAGKRVAEGGGQSASLRNLPR